MDPVQEIKAKLAIEDLVASYVPLKKSGKYLKASCPFHQEKTPSFFVNPERQIAYCFSCHKGGDLFQFIQDIEGVDFKEALELLADKAHVELPTFIPGKAKVSSDEKERLKQIHSDASKFFVHKLKQTKEGEKVLAYLYSRELSDKTLKHFEIGFASAGEDELYRHLLEKGFEKEDLLRSTLVLARDSAGKRVADRFQLRLMVPIDNAQGEVVAFGGRALKKGDQPKYVNSAEYPLYNKSHILYNFGRAKNVIRKADAAVVVEGYFDVMASWQAGVPHVVASCGTALTEEQIKLLKRSTKNVILAFDADAAGQDALLRAVKTAQPLGVNVFVVNIEGGKDAADLVKENPDSWKKAVEERQSYLDFFFEQKQKGLNLSQAADKRRFTDFMLDLLQGVAHPVERDHYLKQLSRLVGTPASMLYDYLNELKHASRRSQTLTKENVPQKTLSKRDRLLLYFMGMVLAFPKIYFEALKTWEDFQIFEAKVKLLGLIKPLTSLDPERYRLFYSQFAESLGRQTSVYKRVSDYYNTVGMVDDGFYVDLENAGELQNIAFEAELKNQDPTLVTEEFAKLLALLYFEHFA